MVVRGAAGPRIRGRPASAAPPQVGLLVGRPRKAANASRAGEQAVVHIEGDGHVELVCRADACQKDSLARRQARSEYSIILHPASCGTKSQSRIRSRSTSSTVCHWLSSKRDTGSQPAIHRGAGPLAGDLAGEACAVVAVVATRRSLRHALSRRPRRSARRSRCPDGDAHPVRPCRHLQPTARQ